MLRIYIAPQIGSGSALDPNPANWNDTTGPWRSRVMNYLDRANGDWHTDVEHPARRIALSLVSGTSATLDAIDADPLITPVIPVRVDDMAGLRQVFATPFSKYPLAWRNNARTFLESNGVNLEWVGAGNTMKDVLRQVVLLFAVCHVADGQRLPNVKEFLKQNLDATVGSISTTYRNEMKGWLESKSIDTSWITLSTTIRQVIAALPSNFNKIYGRAVTMHVFGEEL